MRHTVELNFQEFFDHYGIQVHYVLDENGKEGFCWIYGMKYKIICRDQPREKPLRDLVPTIADERIIFIVDKMYRPSQAYLEEMGISYLETDGILFFADWQGPEEQKKRLKENYYDQQLNESRIKCRNGSAIREGLKCQPELLEKPIVELAKIFDVAKSTMYYYVSQLKKAGYLEKKEEGLKVIEEVFDEDEIMENLLVRGSHRLIPYWKFERFEPGEPIRLKGSGEILKGCIFYDKIEHCKNKREQIKQEVSRGYLVFVSPYASGGAKSLDEEFRKRFLNWFLRRQHQKRVS